MSTKKTYIQFFKKKFLHKCLFKIAPLWREIDNVTYYFLIISKNLKTVYLTFHWRDSWTRVFELVTRKFELVTRGFELITRGFELVLLNFNSCF